MYRCSTESPTFTPPLFFFLTSQSLFSLKQGLSLFWPEAAACSAEGKKECKNKNKKQVRTANRMIDLPLSVYLFLEGCGCRDVGSVARINWQFERPSPVHSAKRVNLALPVLYRPPSWVITEQTLLFFRLGTLLSRTLDARIIQYNLMLSLATTHRQSDIPLKFPFR